MDENDENFGRQIATLPPIDFSEQLNALACRRQIPTSLPVIVPNH
jgi:hypothetical protein